MEIITYSSAKRIGVKRYFPGIPCRQGHIAERMVSNRRCVTCLHSLKKIWNARNIAHRRKVKKVWDAAHKEEQKIKSRIYGRSAIAKMRCKKWREKNPGRVKTACKNWRRRNVDYCKKLSGEWRKKNKERIRENKTLWRKKNPGKQSAYERRRRTLKAGAQGSHTFAQIQQMLKDQNYRCANPICRKDISVRRHVDHVMPISKGGSDRIDNIQLLCPRCNTTKNAKHPEEWKRQIGWLA